MKMLKISQSKKMEIAIRLNLGVKKLNFLLGVMYTEGEMISKILRPRSRGSA